MLFVVVVFGFANVGFAPTDIRRYVVSEQRNAKNVLNDVVDDVNDVGFDG